MSAREDGLREINVTITPRGAAMGVLAVVFLVAIALVATRSSSDDESAADGDTSSVPETTGAGPAFPPNDADRSNYWGLVGVTPLVLDDFEGAADSTSLGRTNTDQTWRAVRGRWGVTGERARLIEREPGDAPQIAVVDGTAEDHLAEVTLMVVEPGAGLVFRYRNPQNYWAVLASADLSGWTIYRVEGGFTAIAGVVDEPLSDGATVAASSRPGRAQIFVEGKLALQVDEPVAPGQTGAGIIRVAEGQGDARWDRFLLGSLR